MNPMKRNVTSFFAVALVFTAGLTALVACDSEGSYGEHGEAMGAVEAVEFAVEDEGVGESVDGEGGDEVFVGPEEFDDFAAPELDDKLTQIERFLVVLVENEELLSPELRVHLDELMRQRHEPELASVLDRLRFCTENGLDEGSPEVSLYLDSIGPLFMALELRDDIRLPPELESQYDELVAYITNAGQDGITPRKKRTRCCSFWLPGISPELGCYQLRDNGFNAFFKCLGLIGNSFSMSKGSCGSNCDYIWYV